jgi:hypothetical protein
VVQEPHDEPGPASPRGEGVDRTTTHRNPGSPLAHALTEGLIPAGAAVLLAVRVLGTALLLGNGWIHWHLDDLGYATVPTIGPLFRLNAVLAVLLAIAVLVTPMPWWRVACAAGALFQLGTLGALGISLTVGLLGFKETLGAPDIPQAVIIEVLGAIALVVGALARRASAPPQ